MSAFIELKIRFSAKPWISGNEGVALLFKIRAWVFGPVSIVFWVMEGLVIPLARAVLMSLRHATQSDLTRYRGRLLVPKLLQRREDIMTQIIQGRGHWIARGRVDKIDDLLPKARKRDRKIRFRETTRVLRANFVALYFSPLITCLR